MPYYVGIRISFDIIDLSGEHMKSARRTASQQTIGWWNATAQPACSVPTGAGEIESGKEIAYRTIQMSNENG